jgi:hypothetical protein
MFVYMHRSGLRSHRSMPTAWQITFTTHAACTDAINAQMMNTWSCLRRCLQLDSTNQHCPTCTAGTELYSLKEADIGLTQVCVPDVKARQVLRHSAAQRWIVQQPQTPQLLQPCIRAGDLPCQVVAIQSDLLQHCLWRVGAVGPVRQLAR